MTNAAQRAADMLAAFGDDDDGASATATETIIANPQLVTSTTSGLDPAAINAERVGLVTIIYDNTASAASLQPMMGAGHDRFIQGLYPAIREGVQILVTNVTMDGKVIYPYMPVQNVPLFGKPAASAGRFVIDDRDYGHMLNHFELMSHTPLFDRVYEMSAAALAEAARFQDPLANRAVNIFVMTISDGVNLRSRRSLGEVADFMEELDDTGFFHRLDMYLGETPPPDHPHYAAVRAELLRYLVRKYTDLLLADFKTEAGYTGLSLMDLLYWYYGRMGTPRDNILLPGDDPKKFRQAIGQASDLALQASGVPGAVTEETE